MRLALFGHLFGTNPPKVALFVAEMGLTEVKSLSSPGDDDVSAVQAHAGSDKQDVCDLSTDFLSALSQSLGSFLLLSQDDTSEAPVANCPFLCSLHVWLQSGFGEPTRGDASSGATAPGAKCQARKEPVRTQTRQEDLEPSGTLSESACAVLSVRLVL